MWNEVDIVNKKLVNIAVIISGIDEEYQNCILKGIKDYAIQQNFNVSCFVSFGGILANKKHDTGEFNIFNLPNFEKFDGVILLTNTIPSSSVVEEICCKVREAGIPAVSIDSELDDSSYYIGIDNFAAMKEIVTHFVKHHNAKKLNFVSGPSNNIDSILRLNAYKEVLAEHDIPIEEERIYNGFFRGQDGRRAVEYFLNSSLPLPDVIICANDTMALSAVIALEKRGIMVPEQVMVSGFDNIYTARNYSPEITSVDRPLYESGYLACEKIYKHINNIPQNRKDILDTTPVFTESCGCNDNRNESITDFKKSNYYALEAYNVGIPIINRMTESLTESETFSDNMEYLKNFVTEIKCEKFFLCLCEDWQWSGHLGNPYYNYEYLTKGYTRSVSVPLAYYDGCFRTHDDFDTSMILPDLFEDSEGGKMYFFSPIHYQDRCLGYSVICNSNFPIDSPVYHTWIMSISTSLENIRKLICLESAVNELEKLYVIDPLGNIYNRNGFTRFTKDLFNDCVINKRKLMIMFIDMDGLKYINDHYGHKEGDQAIVQICNILKNICASGEICARFGGDEFIIFASDYTEKQAEALTQSLVREIGEYNSFSNKPYKIDASSGYYIASPDQNTTMFNVISVADKRMYEAKKKKKHSKYLRRDSY